MSDILIKNINDTNMQYQNFRRNNMGTGGLKIRAYGANEAVPISGLKIVVSTIYDNNKFIFYDGYTDSSGMINKIMLPAPISNPDDLIAPDSIIYSIDAVYEPDNSEKIFNINVYDGVCVLQNITIIPEVKENSYGS